MRASPGGRGAFAEQSGLAALVIDTCRPGRGQGQGAHAHLQPALECPLQKPNQLSQHGWCAAQAIGVSEPRLERATRQARHIRVHAGRGRQQRLKRTACCRHKQ